MPDPVDLSQQRLQASLKEFATLKVSKEELSGNPDDPQTDSEIEGPKTKYKYHCKEMKYKDSFKNASETEWKALCIKHYEFIAHQLTTNKNSKMSAADLAKQYDWDENNYLNCTRAKATERYDVLRNKVIAMRGQEETLALRQSTLA